MWPISKHSNQNRTGFGRRSSRPIAALDAASGSEKPSDAVKWDALVPKKKIAGSLLRVDCLHAGQRLWIKDKAGSVTELYLRAARPELSCGSQAPPRRVSAAYEGKPDDNLHTAGEITDLTLQ